MYVDHTVPSNERSIGINRKLQNLNLRQTLLLIRRLRPNVRIAQLSRVIPLRNDGDGALNAMTMGKRGQHQRVQALFRGRQWW